MKKSISIIGGGPTALLLAAFLDSSKFDVTIYEKNKSLARKFLVAGKGGFNLTHSEPIASFVERYTPSSFLKDALLFFDNEQLRQWLCEIGIPTFIGSSKRVYPEKEIKPITVLNTILDVLKQNKVNIQYEYQWIKWGRDNELIFNEDRIVKSDVTVFALGGGSWKITGSAGHWLTIFKQKGIKTRPFQAANCAYEIAWSQLFLAQNEGKPLKNITIICANQIQKGEAVITKFGLEGNAIYALSPQIQDQLNHQNEAVVYLDLKPSFSQTQIEQRILSSKAKMTDFLKKELKLSPSQLSLLKEKLTKEQFLDPTLLSNKIKKLPLILIAAAPLDEAISTTGGISLDEVNTQYELKKLKNNYCIGEMLDWNAPTGGYLLQACFSMGVYLAKHLNEQHERT